MNFTYQYKKETFDTNEARKILLCSDGLYHTPYLGNIEEDFLDSPLQKF